MADLANNLKTYLKTKSVITSVVGSGSSAKIFLFPNERINAPFILLQIFEGITAETLGGLAGWSRNRVQIDCYHTTYDNAFDLAERVRLCPLQQYRGAIGDITLACVTSDESYDTGVDPPPPGSRHHRYWVSRDYMIWHAETTELAYGS